MGTFILLSLLEVNKQRSQKQPCSQLRSTQAMLGVGDVEHGHIATLQAKRCGIGCLGIPYFSDVAL